MKKQRIRAWSIGALIALVVAAVATGAVAMAAGGEGPVTVKVGELEVSADGSFTPRKLPKKGVLPIGITAAGKVRMANGGHPPAVRQILLEIDKHVSIDTKGLAVCRSGQLQATSTAAAMKACGKALVGTGQTTAQVAFAEQAPIDVPSRLLVFNGGERGGKVTLFVHAYFSNPISGAIIATVTFKKIHHGRFGLLSTTKIPQITGGGGSITSFALKIDRRFVRDGHKTQVFSAGCADGKLKVHVEAKFENGTKAQTEIIRACTPKG